MRYPVVLFDVGETLVGPRTSFGAVYAEVLAEFGLEFPADRIETALRETWSGIDARIPPGIDRYAHYPGGEDEYWLRFARGALERLQGGSEATVAGDAGAIASRSLAALRDAFLDPDAWRIYEEVPEMLEALANAGHRLGVVSNWDSRLPRILKLLGLDAAFETVVVSHLEGVEKPDPGLFRIALERMGIDASEAFHVGDRPDNDLAGARAAGIDAVVVDREGRFARHDFPTVADLSGLPAIARHGL